MKTLFEIWMPLSVGAYIIVRRRQMVQQMLERHVQRWNPSGEERVVAEGHIMTFTVILGALFIAFGWLRLTGFLSPN